MSPSRDAGTLHVITDETLQDRFTHVDLARLAVEGGADVVQLREKRPRTTRQLVETARRMAEVVAGCGARLVIDDRVDVAVEAGVAAVHLGCDDLDLEVARRILGASGWIGATANGAAEAVRVSRAPVDYIGVGPVFGTRSKANPAPELGVEGLRAIVKLVELPVIAIGNITAATVAEVLATGAYGVAVLSPVVLSPDPRSAVRRLREAIDAFRSAGVGRV